MSQYSHLSTPDPEFQAFIDSLPAGALANKPTEINAIREHSHSKIPLLQNATEPFLPKDSEYKVFDRKVSVENGEIDVRAIVPTGDSDTSTFPVLVWYHGGGLISGKIDQDDYDLRVLSVALKVSVVNVEYRLLPEHPYPTYLHDSYAALKWAANNTSELHASLEKGFIIAGHSAGANIAAVLAHWAKADSFFQGKGKQLTGQLLVSPLVIHPGNWSKYPEDLLSVEQNKDTFVFGAEDARKLAVLLGASASDPDMSPLLFPSHAELPSAAIMICGGDLLRDEAFLYEKVLQKAGVKTKTYVYPGVPHSFHFVNPKLSLVRKFKTDLVEAVKWLLEN